MSTSVLYRALGIRGYKHQSIKQQDGGIVIRVRHDTESRLLSPHSGLLFVPSTPPQDVSRLTPWAIHSRRSAAPSTLNSQPHMGCGPRPRWDSSGCLRPFKPRLLTTVS